MSTYSFNVVQWAWEQSSDQGSRWYIYVSLKNSDKIVFEPHPDYPMNQLSFPHNWYIICAG